VDSIEDRIGLSVWLMIAMHIGTFLHAACSCAAAPQILVGLGKHHTPAAAKVWSCEVNSTGGRMVCLFG
jgi:hypothetical protein